MRALPVARSGLVAALFLVRAFLAGFLAASHADGMAPTGEPMRLAVDAAPLVIKGPDGSQRAVFDVEIARSDSEHSSGLMYRTDLPANRAMLFAFQDDDQRYFWMKNTPSSLDILFVARDGTVLNIARDTVPFSTEPIPSDGDAGFVLEVLAGTTARLGIVPGDRLVHPEVGIR